MSDQNLYVYRVVQNYVDFDRPNRLILDFTHVHYRDHATEENFVKGYKKYHEIFHKKHPFDAMLFMFGNDTEASRKEVAFLLTPHRIEQYNRNILREYRIIPMSSFRPKKRSIRKKKSIKRRSTQKVRSLRKVRI